MVRVEPGEDVVHPRVHAQRIPPRPLPHRPPRVQRAPNPLRRLRRAEVHRAVGLLNLGHEQALRLVRHAYEASAAEVGVECRRPVLRDVVVMGDVGVDVGQGARVGEVARRDPDKPGVLLLGRALLLRRRFRRGERPKVLGSDVAGLLALEGDAVAALVGEEAGDDALLAVEVGPPLQAQQLHALPIGEGPAPLPTSRVGGRSSLHGAWYGAGDGQGRRIRGVRGGGARTRVYELAW